MKWWNNLTERSRIIWSVVILLVLIIAFLLILKWLIPQFFETAIGIVVWIFVILAFALALNH